MDDGIVGYVPEDGIAGYIPSGKYANVCRACVDRIVAEESRRHKNARDRDRAVRNRLYQITGAYSRHGAAARAFERGLDDKLRGLDPANPAGWRADCLAEHASTRERLPALMEFYGYIKDICSSAAVVADYGCGLNPFALPLWKPDGLTRYEAYDADTRCVDYANALFRRMGLPEAARALDLVAETPRTTADAALLLKLLPVLDMQRVGRGLELLRDVASPIKVVSFPLAGLSGTDRARRIGGTAARFERDAVEAGLTVVESRRVGSEMVFVISN
ncbi:MAG: hypothetical protein LBS11_06790 [Oscillospiraceae bacterium]|jgi:16S rRNA (guanine(1405)-N(7))-methyltransferase|nr:hypothetical protein [Oscillospiraceae bacterium]